MVSHWSGRGRVTWTCNLPGNQVRWLSLVGLVRFLSLTRASVQSPAPKPNNVRRPPMSPFGHLRVFSDTSCFSHDECPGQTVWHICAAKQVGELWPQFWSSGFEQPLQIL